MCLWLNPFFVWDLWIEPSKSSIFSSSNKVKTFRQTQKKLKKFENFIKRWEKISNFFAKIFTWPSTTYCCQTVSVLLFKRFIVHRTWRKSFKKFFHPSRDYYCHIFFRVVILLLTSKLFDFATYLKITTREKRCTFDLLAPCDFVRQKNFEIIRNFARQSSFRKSRRARTFFKLNVKLSRVSFLISEESSRFAFESAYAKCFIQFFYSVKLFLRVTCYITVKSILVFCL